MQHPPAQQQHKPRPACPSRRLVRRLTQPTSRIADAAPSDEVSQTQTIPVTFTDLGVEDVEVLASPGENILEVASRAGVDVPSGCLSGSCGLCEVEVTKVDAATGAESIGVVRACLAGIPRGYKHIRITDVGDAIWGIDGADF